MSMTVKTQAELDRISLNTNEQIYIEFGTCDNPAIVKNKYLHRVVVTGNSSVVAYGDSSAAAFDSSSVETYNDSSVVAFDCSFIKAHGNSTIKAYGNAQVADQLLSEGSIQLSENARKVCMPKKL